LTADIKKLSDSLRRDTPEQALERAIGRRRAELLADLSDGRTFEIRDLQGRVVRISPRAGSRSEIA
jgi:hypothetical protein